MNTRETEWRHWTKEVLERSSQAPEKKKKNLKKVYVVKEDLEMVDVTVEEAGDRVRRRQTIRSGNP